MMNESIFVLSNNSNTSSAYINCKHREPDSDLEFIVKRAVFVLLVILGITLNIFIIIVSIKYTAVRKYLHQLVINMAVSDALFLFAFSVREIFWLSNKTWSIYPNGISGDIVCKVVTLLLEISYRVSLITLFMISIERFRATRPKLQRLRPYTVKERVAVLCACWLTPTIVASFYAYVAEASDGRCHMPLKEDETYQVLSFFVIIFHVMALVVCFAILVLSNLTIRRLFQLRAIEGHLNKEQRNVRARRIQAVVRMVLVSVLVYLGCWLSAFAYNVIHNVTIINPSIKIIDLSVCIDWRLFHFVIFYVLPSVNPCISPCICIIFLTDLREAAKKALY